ncbi:MAG: hypothetical protein ABL904_10910 [Hyphomicrobiaceae bacterium]
MPTLSADPRTVVVSPVVISAALDCLGVLADLDPIQPAHMHRIARALGCREPEATAVTLRLLATATVLNDDRWLPWSRFYRRLTPDGRRIFNNVLMHAVASLALDSRGRFDADAFFDELLHILADPHTIRGSGGAHVWRQ